LARYLSGWETIMGGHFWSHHVPYQEDIRAALEALREQEFRAGRFRLPTQISPGFFGRFLGRKPSKPKPPATIREAIKIAETDATGTRSILDMERISDTPTPATMSPVPREELTRLLGTVQPTREMVENCEELIDAIDRGCGIYVVTYKAGKPDGIYFAGYSFD
jgi:hypothetical protein